jgi:FkbM family methyltransferase
MGVFPRKTRIIKIYNSLITRFNKNRLSTRMILGKPHVFKGSPFVGNDYDDAWLLALAHESKFAFDIGCNVGHSGLLMLNPNSIEILVCIDPNPDTLIKCAETMILNRVEDKIRLVCGFAADKPDDQITFYAIDTGAASSMYKGHAKSANKKGSSIKVNTTTIDTICGHFNLLPDLIKIDVEGAEYKVLQGALELVKRKQTRFIVEVHSLPELSMTENAAHICDWCRLCGYIPWYLKTKKTLTNPEILSNRGRCHLLLLPESEAFPDYLKHINQGAPPEIVPKAFAAPKSNSKTF